MDLLVASKLASWEAKVADRRTGVEQQEQLYREAYRYPERRRSGFLDGRSG